MNLYCRNADCEHHTRIIDTARHPTKCPLCGTPLPNDANFDEPALPLPPITKPKLDPPPPLSDPLLRLKGREHDHKPAPPSPDRKPAASPGFLPNWLHRRIEDDERLDDPGSIPFNPDRTVLPASAYSPPAPKPPSNPEILSPRKDSDPDRVSLGSNKKPEPAPPPRSKPKPAPQPKPLPPIQKRSPFVNAEEIAHGEGTLFEVRHTELPVIGTGPKFVLERVIQDRFDPIDFIDGSRETPLYSGEGKARRVLVTLRMTPQGVQLTPRDSLNGVAIRIKAPVRLRPGRRFRVGNYVIEARESESFHHVDPRVEEGERFFAKDLGAQAELVFIRPDGSDGLRYPILRKTTIGRGRSTDPLVDIPLLDENVSRRHASVSPRESGLKLKDLGSTNGTFVQIHADVILTDGDYFRLGEMVLRLVNYRGV